ncbi:hypothetical protein Tco_0343073, partial [Tanacetum coccineum]
MMTVHNDLPKQIHETQEEAMKGENVEAENLGRLIKPIFKFCPDGMRCFGNRVWLPEVDINKKTENQAKMTKLSMEWKRL